MLEGFETIGTHEDEETKSDLDEVDFVGMIVLIDLVVEDGFDELEKLSVNLRVVFENAVETGLDLFVHQE